MLMRLVGGGVYVAFTVDGGRVSCQWDGEILAPC